MGRCRSTPGLVESKGQTDIEDMAVSGNGYHAADPNSAFFDVVNDGASSQAEHQSSSSSTTHYGEVIGGIPMEAMNVTERSYESQKHARRQSAGPLLATNSNTQKWTVPKAGGMKPTPSYGSLHSVSNRPVSPYQSNESPFVMDKNHIQFPFGNRPEPSQEALLAEIKRLRERLVTLEADNASMSLKLSQQQWEVQNRLAEIELHICSTGPSTGPGGPTSPGSGSGDERNRESII